MLQQKAIKWLINQKKKLILRHLTYGWKVSEEDILFFSIVFEDNLQLFVKNAEWSEKLCALVDGYELKRHI
jgi:hypothetical protein